MTKRDKTIERLHKMALKLSKKFDYDLNKKMWTLCYDWNSEHEDAEIFMCDDEDEEGRYRYFIEDDYYYLAD